MSKFTKQAKIKDRQAGYWMQVCHHAMQVHPDAFPSQEEWKKGAAADVICGLLTELAMRQESADAGTVFDERSPFTDHLPKCDAKVTNETVTVGCSRLKGHRDCHLFKRFPRK